MYVCMYPVGHDLVRDFTRLPFDLYNFALMVFGCLYAAY